MMESKKQWMMNLVRYFVALLNKTEDGYERDPKHPSALNFYEMIDVLKEK